MSKRTQYRHRFGKPNTERPHYELACALPVPASTKLVRVYVEGYEDVAFWRGIFDDYESDRITFEISVPPRRDLAKGKKVLFNMLDNMKDDPQRQQSVMLCADSDFDYLFGNSTDQSALMNQADNMFHTYAYATENFLCYAPSLHNVCVKATKNDTRIFDFEGFLADYSRTIYPLFIWYAFSAQRKAESFFTLIDFKSSVKINYLELRDCGAGTLEWLGKQVDRRLESLHHHHDDLSSELAKFKAMIEKRGITPENAYLFMQGHTLMDNVVMVLLHAVCDQLMLLTNATIAASTKQGVALRNEQSNYNNSLRNVRDILLDNENYKDCFLYKKLKADIDRHINTLLKQ